MELAPGETETEVTWTEPVFDDNVEVVEVKPNLPPGTPLAAGHHEIVYTAMDDAGFSAKCTFTITVTSPTA